MNVPDDLLYTESHEWVRRDGDTIRVGITDHAQAELTDVVYVELPKVGATYEARSPVAVVESVKAASDIYAPVKGTVLEGNKALESNPALINTDPYGEGWIFLLKMDDAEQLKSLKTPKRIELRLASIALQGGRRLADTLHSEPGPPDRGARPRPRTAIFRLASGRNLRHTERMRKMIAGTLFLLLLVMPLTRAAVINVEFKFTPFVGDPAQDQEVTTVPGKAVVSINNVMIAEQELRAEKSPVLFEAHEVTAAVWVPISSVGPVVRKGKNKIRIEFTPNDAKQSYRAQLRWASVLDEETQEVAPGSVKATNQADEGVDDRKALQGKAVFERAFTADFALDLPWHHYPAVSSLTEEDKQKIAALLKTRAEWFQPDFAALYKAIDDNESLKVDDVRKARCLEAVYKLGVRVTAPPAGELEFATTDGPEVVVTRKSGSLWGLDEKTFAPVKDEEVQMCAGMALSAIYPGRIVAVRKPEGTWEIVY